MLDKVWLIEVGARSERQAMELRGITREQSAVYLHAYERRMESR